MAEELLVLDIDSAKKISYLLDKLLSEAVFSPRNGSWMVREIDPAHVCLVEIEIGEAPPRGATNFTVYTDLFRKAVQKASRKHVRSVTIVRVGDNIVLREVSEIIGSVGGEPADVPSLKLNLPAEYMMSGDIHGFFKAVSSLSDAVGFLNDKIYVPTPDGDLFLDIYRLAGRIGVTWNNTESWGIYTIDYILSAIPPRLDNAEFHLGDNMPVMIRYLIGHNIHVKIYIAPRIEESKKPEPREFEGNAYIEPNIICKYYKRLQSYDEWAISTYDDASGLYVLSLARDVIIRVTDIVIESSVPINKVLSINSNMLYKFSCLLANYYPLVPSDNPLLITDDKVFLLGVRIGYEADQWIKDMIEFVRNKPYLAATETYTLERKKTKERLAYIYDDKVYVVQDDRLIVTGKVEPPARQVYAVPEQLLPRKAVVEIDTSTPEGLSIGTDGIFTWWIAFDYRKIRELLGEKQKKPLELLLDTLFEHYRLTTRIRELGWETVWEAIREACSENKRDALVRIYDDIMYFPVSFIRKLLDSIYELPEHCRPPPVVITEMYAKVASTDPKYIDRAIDYAVNVWDRMNKEERKTVLAHIEMLLREHASVEELESILENYDLPREMREAVEEVLREKKKRLGLEKEEELEALRKGLVERLSGLSREADKIYEDVIAKINYTVYREDGLLSVDDFSRMAEELRNAVDRLREIMAEIENVKGEAYAHSFYEIVDTAENIIKKISGKYIKVAEDTLKVIDRYYKEKTEGVKQELRREEETAEEIRAKCEKIRDWLGRAGKLREEWERLRHLFYDELGAINAKKTITGEDLRRAEELVKEIEGLAEKLKKQAEELMSEYESGGYADYGYTCLGERSQELYNLAFLIREAVVKDADYFEYASPRTLDEIRKRLEEQAREKTAEEKYREALQLLLERVRRIAEEHGVHPPSREEVERVLSEEWEALKGASREELERAIDMLARELVARQISKAMVRRAREHGAGGAVTVTVPKPTPVTAPPVSPASVAKSLTPRDWYYILVGGVRYWWKHIGKSRVPEDWLPTIEAYIIDILRRKGEELMSHPSNYIDYMAGYIMYENAGSIVSQGLLHGLYNWWSTALYFARRLWKEASRQYGFPYLENVWFTARRRTKSGGVVNVLDTNGLVVFLYSAVDRVFRAFGAEALEKYSLATRLLYAWKEKGYPEVVEVWV